MRGNAAMEERKRRKRIAEATAIMPSEVLSLCLRVRMRAYTSHAMDAMPQLLWTPPRDCRREVAEVLIQRGTHSRPTTLTASQNTTRSSASLLHMVSASTLIMEKRAGFSLAYGKWPVVARTRVVTLRDKKSAKRRL